MSDQSKLTDFTDGGDGVNRLRFVVISMSVAALLIGVVYVGFGSTTNTETKFGCESNEVIFSDGKLNYSEINEICEDHGYGQAQPRYTHFEYTHSTVFGIVLTDTPMQAPNITFRTNYESYYENDLSHRVEESFDAVDDAFEDAFNDSHSQNIVDEEFLNMTYYNNTIFDGDSNE